LYPLFRIDREWVDLVNTERQSQQLDRLSYELFEVIMDKLEKEWFDLVSSR
jgi:NuA3 HAT complex component NTO1